MFQYSRAAGMAVAFSCLPALFFLLGGCDTGNAAIDLASTDTPGTPPGTTTTPPATTAYEYKVFAMNRRGMAFPDKDFTVSAIFPPANFLVAQVLRKSSDPMEMPTLLDESRVDVRYLATTDSNGSINSFSGTKTNFWNHADDLYHFYTSNNVSFERDEGVHGPASQGQWMPGQSNQPQPFTLFDSTRAIFTAPYIPITPTDNRGAKNYFPLYKVVAIDKTSQELLATTVVPLPMAEPMRCQVCHQTGGVAADERTSERFGSLEWSSNPDAANNAKENIAILHSVSAGIDLTIRQPYLCAECHYSPIADPDGRGPEGDYQTRRNPLSISIHAWHSLDRDRQVPLDNGQALIPENGEASCKICHGSEQPYTRGSMHSQGIVCQDCHGGLAALGKSPLVGAGAARQPFADEPRCESCHTGDELSHLGDALVLRRAYEDGDQFATPRLAANRRFAEEPDTLYRSSVGHGGVSCMSCHGSPHAEWPVSTAGTHDNDIASQLQGHVGSIIECAACHGPGLELSLRGPHGLHNIDDPDWVMGHGSFYAADPAACQSCHGADLLGGRLSRAAASRSFALPDGRTRDYDTDQPVGCADCHALP
jgi:Cytochrome c3